MTATTAMLLLTQAHSGPALGWLLLCPVCSVKDGGTWPRLSTCLSSYGEGRCVKLRSDSPLPPSGGRVLILPLSASAHPVPPIGNQSSLTSQNDGDQITSCNLPISQKSKLRPEIPTRLVSEALPSLPDLLFPHSPLSILQSMRLGI